jgi:hypothetical protein
MAGAPPQDHEAIYASSLALGGATAPRTETGVAPVVAAGVTAAVVHGIGDFFPRYGDWRSLLRPVPLPRLRRGRAV